MSRTIKRLFFLLTGTALISGSGCIKLWQDNLDIKTYMLEPARETEPHPSALADKLWVGNVSVLPPYNIRSLVLRESDVEFSPSYYSELLLAPSENFRNAFYNWFSESGLFLQVSIVDRQETSHSLNITVRDFYADMKAEKAVLRIQVVLLDEATRGNRVLLSKSYREDVAVEEHDPEALIRAYNTALNQILTRCESDFAVVLNAVPE